MRKSAGTVNVRSMDAPTMAKLQETFPAKKANEPRRISVSPRTSAVDTAKLNRANSGKYATVARSSMFAPPTSEPRRLSDRVPPTEKTPKREPLVPAQTLSDPIKSSSPAGTSPVISGRPIRAARASSVDMFNGSGSSLPTSTANQYATVATDNPFLHLRKTAGGGQVREKVSWKQWVDVEESEDEDNMKDAEIVHEFRPHINHVRSIIGKMYCAAESVHLPPHLLSLPAEARVLSTTVELTRRATLSGDGRVPVVVLCLE
eukprot:590071_1